MRKLLLRIACSFLTAAVGLTAVKIHHFFQPGSATSTTKQEFVVDSPSTETIFSCKRPELPTLIKVLLDRKFPGWEFPDVSDEDCQTIKQLSGPKAHAELIQGDFDGNGRLDYAVLIEHGVTADNSGVAHPDAHIVAFLNRYDRYKMMVVTHEGGECLQLMRRGNRDYDYDAQREFNYANDAIFSGFGMGGTSYLYENGKFRAIITSD